MIYKAQYLFIIILLLISSSSYAEIIFKDNFDNYANIAAVDAVWWEVGSQVSLVSGAKAYSGKGNCIKWNYDSEGTAPYVFTRSILSSNLSEIYIQAKFKVERNKLSQPQGGCKFIKPSGVVTQVSGETCYANSTLNLGKTTATYPKLEAICYGNGTSLRNDTQQKVFMEDNINNQYAEDPLVGYFTQTTKFTPTEGEWFTVEAQFKYNSNGNRDGEYAIWINDNLMMHVTNVKNRNDLGSNVWSFIRFGDYANSNANMNLYMDDVVVSDKPIGRQEDSQGLLPPSGVKADIIQ